MPISLSQDTHLTWSVQFPYCWTRARCVTNQWIRERKWARTEYQHRRYTRIIV